MSISTDLYAKLFANSLTAVAEDLEFLRGGATNYSAEPMSAGRTINIPIVRNQTSGTVTAAATPPALAGANVDAGTITLSSHKKVAATINTSEYGNYNVERWMPQLMTQLGHDMAALINADLAAKYKRVATYTGADGTAPFASNLNNITTARVALMQQGCPKTGLQLLANPRDFEDILQSTNVTYVNQYGSAEGRQGGAGMRGDALYNVLGMDRIVMERDLSTAHTIGSDASAYQVVGAQTAGTSSVPIDTGTGTILEGDIVSITGTDGVAWTYAVTADLSTAGNLGIFPALQNAVANNAPVTKVGTASGDYYVSVMCHPTAFGFGMAPTMPVGVSGWGPNADVVMIDSETGIPLELRVRERYHALEFEVSALYGVELIDWKRARRIIG